MGDTSTSGGGKSTQVQAPQRTAAPVDKSSNGGGFVRASKKQIATTAGDHNFFKKETAFKGSTSVPKNPYPLLHRNDPCGCKSGKKFKKCCMP